MSDSPEKPLFVDEDWKARVQAERAAAAQAQEKETSDLKTASAAATSPSAALEAATKAAPEPEPELPPASMMLLISTLATQALVAMGYDPRSSGAKPRLAEARHFIDTLAVLEEKTKGNLTKEEAGALEDVLHQLRMAFVQAKEK